MATIRLGIFTIRSGSLIEIVGVTCLSTIAIFTLVEVFVIIVNLVTSLPVPAVVLIAIEVGGQAVLGRQLQTATPWLTERHGYDPTLDH